MPLDLIFLRDVLPSFLYLITSAEKNLANVFVCFNLPKSYELLCILFTVFYCWNSNLEESVYFKLYSVPQRLRSVFYLTRIFKSEVKKSVKRANRADWSQSPNFILILCERQNASYWTS